MGYHLEEIDVFALTGHFGVPPITYSIPALPPSRVEQDFSKSIYGQARNRIMPAQGVGELGLRAPDHGRKLALGQVALPASKLDLDRDGRRHEATAEITQ